MSETSTYHILLVAVITPDLHTYTPKHLYLYPGLALITLGIALIATALINAQIGYSPGIHTSMTGGMRKIIAMIFIRK